MRLLAFVAICVSSACFVGCSDSTGPQAVSGKVTFKGKPLDKGEIIFFSDKHQARGEIVKGEFSIAGSNGPKPGTYTIRISSLDESHVKVEPVPGMPTQAKERIPPEFNKNSTKQVEVTAGGENSFTFDIP